MADAFAPYCLVISEEYNVDITRWLFEWMASYQHATTSNGSEATNGTTQEPTSNGAESSAEDLETQRYVPRLVGRWVIWQTQTNESSKYIYTYM